MRLSSAIDVAEAAQGCEWVVEAHHCSPDLLRDLACLADLFNAIISEVGLHPVEQPLWHTFPGEGGITGLCLLSESHLACHTFPEHGSICINLFCCQPKAEWDFKKRLGELLGASSVSVRKLVRSYRP